MTTTYTPIKCPNCGSGSIVHAEGGRIFCKSCDQYSEKSTTLAIRTEPTKPPEPKAAKDHADPPKPAENNLLPAISWIVLILFVILFYAIAK